MKQDQFFFGIYSLFIDDTMYYILPARISSTPAPTTFLRWLCFSQVKLLQIYQGSPIQEADIVGYQASLGLP